MRIKIFHFLDHSNTGLRAHIAKAYLIWSPVGRGFSPINDYGLFEADAAKSWIGRQGGAGWIRMDYGGLWRGMAAPFAYV